MPQCVIFVDYEKVFNFIINALRHQHIHKKYICTLLNANTNCSMSIQLFYQPINIPIRRGIRQGDTISPKLFIAALEDAFLTTQLQRIWHMN